MSYHLSPVLTMLGLLPYPVGCLLLLKQTSDVTLIHNDVKYHNIDDKINKHDKCQFKMYTDGQFSRSWSYILAVLSSCQHGYKANLLRHIDKLKKGQPSLSVTSVLINHTSQDRLPSILSESPPCTTTWVVIYHVIIERLVSAQW